MKGTKVFSVFIIFAFYYLAAVHCEDECPSSPCLDPKPQLQPTQSLAIDLFYHEDNSDSATKLWKNVCKLVGECGGLIEMHLKPGALTEKKNGEITCGDYCYENKWQICLGIIDTTYFTSCKEANISDLTLVENCVDAGRADDAIVTNGNLRIEKGIPACKLPTLTFNGSYDLCVTQDSYDDIKAYVCGLYNNAINCCSN